MLLDSTQYSMPRSFNSAVVSSRSAAETRAAPHQIGGVVTNRAARPRHGRRRFRQRRITTIIPAARESPRKVGAGSTFILEHVAVTEKIGWNALALNAAQQQAARIWTFENGSRPLLSSSIRHRVISVSHHAIAGVHARARSSTSW
jgi:hypothetical protein